MEKSTFIAFICSVGMNTEEEWNRFPGFREKESSATFKRNALFFAQSEAAG